MKPNTQTFTQCVKKLRGYLFSAKFPSVFFLSILLATNVFAGNKNWEGDVSSDWNNANNWQGNALPGANDVTIDPSNYTYAPVISANSTVGAVKKITVSGGGVLTIQANITAADDITVTGAGSRIDMSAGTVTCSVGNKDIILDAGGTFNLTGGSLTSTGKLDLKNATFNMSGTPTLSVGSTLEVEASSANCLFSQSGGTTTVTTSVNYAAATNAWSATVSVSGGTFTNNGTTDFANSEDDLTPFNISGGTVSLVGNVAENGSGNITFNVSSTASLTFSGNLTMDATDVFTQTGGTVTFTGNKTWSNAGTLSASGGTMVFNDANATTITGAGTWNFYNVTINSGKVLTATNPTNINIKGNWTNSGGTFNEGTKRVTFNGSSGDQTITGAETFYDLTVSKSSGKLILANNVVASNSLTMTQGNIETGSNKITLGTSTANIGTLNYTVGTIVGKFERWLTSTGGTARLFPVGTATSYRPATFTATTIVGGSLIAEFIASDPGSSGLSLSEGSATVVNQFTEGYWDFTAANSLTSTNYRMDLTATGFTSYGLEGSVRVLKRTNSGSAWTLQGTHVDLSSFVAGRTALNGISTAQFGLGRSTCPTSTATVTQPTTTDVWQGIAGNEIIRIAVNSSASACTQNITQFNFTTAGTPGCSAASTDIANARVYYTGTSATFATSSLFGTLGSAPNGAFTINGSQSITSNTVYFWLTYEIAGTSAVNNRVDGQLVSYVMGGTTVSGGSLTTPDPAGSRTIKGQRFSITNGNWNATSTWAYTSGGASGASVPTASTPVYIEDGDDVTVNSSGAVAAALSIASNGSASKLIVTTGGNLTCSSISMTTTDKKVEMTVQGSGSLTVNGNVSLDYTNGGDNLAATGGIQVNSTASVTINGNLTLVNPTAKTYYMVMNGTSITSVTGNVSLSGNAADRMFLGMGGTARLNVKGSFGIAASKYGELYNTDGLHTSIINFNGTTAQILEVNTSASNTNGWLYSIVWINNPAGVTLNNNVVDNTTRNSIRKSLIVKSGTLKTGGYSINLDDLTTALFQVDNGAAFYTTTVDAFGGMPDFGSVDNDGRITLGATSTVTFAGASQVVPILSGVNGSAYGNIIIAGTGTKTLGRPHHANFSGTGALDINGNLTTSSGVIFDVSGSNYNITIAGNWTDQHAVAGTGFTERAGTVTFDGTTTQIITPTASPMTFYRLTVNKSAGTLNIVTSDVTASNMLTMTAGNINTSTRTLTLGTSTASVGTYSRTSGTIIGKFKRWLSATGSKEFPVGTSTYYRPAAVNFSQITAGSMEVEFVASSASNTGLPLTENSITVGSSNILTEGYWRCTAANSLASTNYSVTLTTAGFTSRIISSNTRVIKRANSGSSWTLDGTHVAATGTTVARSALSGFSEFAVVTANCVPAVTASITVTSHACNNSGGALTLSTTNAQTPVGYTWSNGATTQNISNLVAGNYTVTVLDYNNCTATATAAVGVTSTSIAVTHSTNYDTPNGAIDLTVSGGTGPYTYLWNDKGADVTTQDRTGLQNGWYVATITDAGGCKYVKSALLAYMDTIHAGSYIVDMGVSPQAFGNGLKPFGLIFDIVRNYHVPIEWVINPDKSLYGTDFTLDGIDYKGGPFVIEAEYFDNTLDNRIKYWETQGVVGDYTTSDIVVPVYAKITGFSNLGIDEQNEGIVIPYFNNAVVPTNVYYVGLPSALGACDNAYVLPHADPTWANHHYLKTFVQDNGYVWAGCHANSVLEGIYNPVDNTDRMNFLSQTGLQCYGGNKCGSLITETHGNAITPYIYDNTIGAHPLMQFMGDLTPSTENGSEDWYIPLSTGGWNTGTYRAIKTSDGAVGKEGIKLAFGNAFDDKDNGLVMYEAGHSINRGTTESKVAAQRAFFDFILHSGIDRRLLATITAPTSMAEGTGAAVSVTVTSGGAPFTYAWTTNVNGSFASPTSASTTFNLTKGNGRPYARITVTITDACGRIYSESKTISVLYGAGPIVSWYNGYNISCNGGSDGTITVQGEGGTPPYSYEWGHGATTASVTGLSAGEYTVTITDALLLAIYDTITLSESPTAVEATAVSTGTILCYNDSTGSIDMTVTGGLTPYIYLWSSGQSTEDISNLPSGTYDVTVTDMNGCYAQTSPPLSIGPDSLTINDTITDASCNGGSDGVISLTITGGTTPYSYSWSTGATASSIAGITAGEYFVTVTDSNSCTKNDSSTVGQATSLSLSATQTNVLCNGAATGAVDLTVSGGTLPYAFSWSSGETSEDISSKAAGAYTVTVTDDNGCTSSISRTLTQPAALSFSMVISDVSCFGAADGEVVVSVSGGVAPYVLTDSYASSDPVPATFSGLSGMDSWVWVEDANGCITDSQNVVVIEPAAALSSTLSVTDVTTNGGSDGAISQIVSGGTGPFTYSWSNAAATEDVTGLIAGSYTVTITDANSCTLTKSATVDEPGACPCTWLGTFNNSWGDGNNWDCGFEPTDTCNVVIPAGTPFPCQIIGIAECKNLTIQLSATLTIINTNQLDIYGNFTNHGTFTQNNSKVTFKAAVEQHIWGITQTSFWNIWIDNSSATGIVMHNTIKVYGDLRLIDGYLFTGDDNTVRMETNSQGALLVFNPNSFIVGKLFRKINNTGHHGYEFPVGDAGNPTRFFRAYIRTHNLQDTDDLTVWFGPMVRHSNTDLLTACTNPPTNINTYIECHHALPIPVIINGDTTTTTSIPGGLSESAYINQNFNMEATIEDDGIQYSSLAPEGIWYFEPNTQPDGGFYDMFIYIANLSGLEDNNFGLLKRPSGRDGKYWSGGDGQMKPFNGEGRKLLDGYAMRTMLTRFSEGGGGGGGGGGLPIELLSFDAKLMGDQVELTWVTATEINNDYFTVEKSNGKEFKQIAIISGAGNSSTTKYYSKIDYEPFVGTSYYRLKQTDYDGKFAYSDIVSITYEPEISIDDDNEIIIFPNPSGGQFSVVVRNPSEKVTLFLYDAKGKLVYNESYAADEENSTHHVKLENLAQGVYYLKADFGSTTLYTRKLMLFGEK